MISWLGEKLRHWAEERRKDREAMQMVAEHRASGGTKGPFMEFVMVNGEVRHVSSDDPEYPPDLYPRVKMSTMCGTAMTSGSGEAPISIPRGD